MSVDATSDELNLGIPEYFESWLKLQPRNVAVVLAARSAMRALPEVIRGLPTGGGATQWFIESHARVAFRACATALRCATNPSRDADRRASLAHNNSFHADGRYTAIRAARAALDTALAATNEGAAAYCLHAIKQDSYTAVRDAQFLARGGTVQQLARQPLWNNRPTPGWIVQYWTQLSHLFPQENYWEVWIKWYEDHLSGQIDSDDYEAVFSSVPGSEWDKGTKEANLWIWERLSKLPDIPAQRPATIEPILVGENITLSVAPPTADLFQTDVAAALAALKSRFERLLDEIERANIDPRFPVILRDFIDRLPSTVPDARTLFDMGHELSALRGYEPTVMAEWPSALGPRYSAAVLALDMTLQKFPKWKEFAATPALPISPEQAGDITEIARIFVSAMRAEGPRDHIDEVVPATLEVLASSGDRLGGGIAPMSVAGRNDIARDELESINNILKIEASILPEEPSRTAVASKLEIEIRKAGDDVWKGAKEATSKILQGIGSAMVYGPVALFLIIGANASGIPVFEWLLTNFKQQFGWLEPFLKWLGLL